MSDEEDERKKWGLCWYEVGRERRYRDELIAERDALLAERTILVKRIVTLESSLQAVRIRAVHECDLAGVR